MTIVWGETAENQRPDIRSKTSTNGGQTFSDPVSITTSEFYELCPSVLIEGSNVTAAWLARTGSSSLRVSASRSIDGGQSWGEPETVATFDNDTALGFSGYEGRPILITSDSGTELFVRSGQAIKGYSSVDGQTWSPTESPGNTNLLFFDLPFEEGLFHLAGSSNQVVGYAKGGSGLGPSGDRTLSLTLRRHRVARGSINSEDPDCESNVQVMLQRRTSTGWRTVAKTASGSDGSFSNSVRDRPGKFRARVAKQGHCQAATSPVAVHRHYTALPLSVARCYLTRMEFSTVVGRRQLTLSGQGIPLARSGLAHHRLGDRPLHRRSREKPLAHHDRVVIRRVVVKRGIDLHRG